MINLEVCDKETPVGTQRNPCSGKCSLEGLDRTKYIIHDRNRFQGNLTGSGVYVGVLCTEAAMSVIMTRPADSIATA